jgi:hypothetical protein
LLDLNNNKVDSVIQGGKTKIVAQYVGDYTNLPSGADSISGSIFMDLANSQGGVQNRRVANSNVPSEDSSPFTAPDPNPNAVQSYAQGNARVNLFTTADGTPNLMTVETIYDDSQQVFKDMSNVNNCPVPAGGPTPTGTVGGVIFTGTVTPIADELRLFNDGDGHLWHDGTPAKW